MKTKLVSNSEDRYKISPAVEKYMKQLSAHYPEINDKLKILRSTLSNDLSCLC